MQFTAENNDGLKIPIDAHLHLGGKGLTPNPIDYLIASLGGCVGIKILLDLSDTGITPEVLLIDIQGTRKQTLPAVFEQVHLIITIKAPIDDVRLSETLTKTMRFLCPIAAMFGSVSEVTWEHRIVET
ncbi:MAG TPA: OsmC family protein [Methanospirillum sp.]|nr:OsmC family protein [Methanospirillum sp.]